jgi:hypothetical protein
LQFLAHLLLTAVVVVEQETLQIHKVLAVQAAVEQVKQVLMELAELLTQAVAVALTTTTLLVESLEMVALELSFLVTQTLLEI